MAIAFTERELDIMAVLWERGPSTVAEVRAALADPLSHNTVATMLTILENKGRVSHTEEGRAFRYLALVRREEAGASAFTRLIDTVFGGSAELFLTQFVSERRLSREEITRLSELLDSALDNALNNALDEAPKTKSPARRSTKK
jgi:BlaI family transcriptional regulator, penicillinase repressor